MFKTKNRKGEPVTLYTPAEKGEIYAFELRNSYSTKTGDALSHAQRSYRSGYLDARKDNAKAWKYNQKKKAAKRKSAAPRTSKLPATDPLTHFLSN